MSLEPVQVFAPLPCLKRGKTFVIGGDPAGKKFLYGNLGNVIIRDVEDIRNCDIYCEHLKNITTAQFSPSGYYICSGDEMGNIKIWDAKGEEHIKKSEFRVLAQEVKDIAWDGESKRIAVCGPGAEGGLAKAIFFDTGASVGELVGVKKAGNSLSFRQMRPFKLVIADEGFLSTFYQGPPFKFVKENSDHGNFVNFVRFSPDGAYYATASSDKHVYLYEGKTGDKVADLGCGKGAHTGGVYSLAWNPNSKELLTVSGDKTAKIWNVETKEEVLKFTFGNKVEDMQLSCLWLGEHIMTISLSGCINFLDRENPTQPKNIWYGHSKSLTSVQVIPGDKLRHVSGDIDGKVLRWDTDAGVAQPFPGHAGAKVSGILYDSANDEIISAGWDDKISFSSASCDAPESTTLKLPSQPLEMTMAKDTLLVLCHESIALVRDKKIVGDVPHPQNYNNFQPKIIAAGINNDVALEAEEDKVNIYRIEGNMLVKTDTVLPATMGLSSLAYSPDGSMLAVASENKLVEIYMVADGYKLAKKFVGHVMKVTVLAWSPDSQTIASFGIDPALRVWNIATGKGKEYSKPHQKRFIKSISWIDNNSFLTAADDCMIRRWSFRW